MRNLKSPNKAKSRSLKNEGIQEQINHSSVGLISRQDVVVGDQHSVDAVHEAHTEVHKLRKDVNRLEGLHASCPGGESLPLYRGVCKGMVFSALLDSGASTSYIAPKLGHLFSLEAMEPREVHTAGGKRLQVKERAKIDFTLDGCGMSVDAYVLNMGFDLVLGRNWLAKYNPQADWETDAWKIKLDDKLHIIKPERYLGQSGLEYLLSHKQIDKALKSDVVEETFLIHPVTDDKDEEPGAMLKDLVHEFGDVFRDDLPPELPPDRGVEHVIETGDAKPVSRQPYKMSPAELVELRKQLDELLRLGLIEPSASPWGAPILFVKKKDGSMRMCVDYRALNKVTIRNKYPLPRIDECLEQLQGASYFSSLDLKSGYHQVRISAKDVPKTAMNCRYGQFSWRVLPFGLCNSPPTFQAMVNRILKDYIDRFVLVYVDDILIFSRSEAEHKEHVRLVLEKLREAKLYANFKKCDFGKREVEFLGFRVSVDGILPANSKVDAVREWKVPTNVQEVRQFVGLAQHFRRFIPGFASLASPLTDLTKGTGPKKRAIQWSAACQASFEEIKAKLTEAPVLRTPDASKPFRVDCDASDVGVGAVLLQQGDGDDKVWHPIAYESRKLSSAERNYPAQERELLAILHALRTWRCYLDGREYQVYTDHHTLKYLRSQQKPTPRLVRWINELELFDPTILYQQGKLNCVPDALSRKDYNGEPNQESLEPDFLYVVASNIPAEHREDWPLYYLQQPEDLPDSVKDFLEQEKDHFVVRQGKVYRKVKVKQGAKAGTVQEVRFLPFVQRADKVEQFHQGFGHAGRLTVFDLMRYRFWWPTMRIDIQDWIKTCPACQLNGQQSSSHHDEMRPLDIPGAFERWHLDFIGELPKTVHGNRWILMAVDYTTNYPVARAIPEATAEAVANFLYEEIVMRFSCPKEILTDRGANFMSKVVQHYVKRIGANHKFTSSFHPRTNGKCERLNGTFKQMLRKYVNGALHLWDEYVDTALFACRVRTHASVGYSPYYLTYGRDPTLPGDIMRPLISQEAQRDPRAMAELTAQELERLNQGRAAATARMKVISSKDKERWDQAIEPFDFEIGDHVKMTHETRFGLEPRYKGPYVIIGKNEDFGTYKLETLEGKPLDSWVHVDRLAKVNIGEQEPTSPWYNPTQARAHWRQEVNKASANNSATKLMAISSNTDLPQVPGAQVVHRNESHVQSRTFRWEGSECRGNEQ